MYQIRVRPDGSAIDVTFSERLPAEEVLRAISQAFALASAGNVTRALCDLRGVVSGPAVEALAPIAASLRGRLFLDQRVALLCEAGQLALARRFARAARAGTELGVFTREEDARSWLAGAGRQRLSSTALRHLHGERAPERQEPVAGKKRRTA